MMAYLDTSALVKLFVSEAGSDELITLVGEADLLGTGRVAYPEARAAFARRQREGALSAADHASVVAALDERMGALVVVELTRDTASWAGGLADRRALRGYDAIHLASALRLRAILGEEPLFVCYDERLAQAARAEDLPVWPECVPL